MEANRNARKKQVRAKHSKKTLGTALEAESKETENGSRNEQASAIGEKPNVEVQGFHIPGLVGLTLLS